MDPYASRETLDHSIMYIFAVALEDGAWHHVKSYTPLRARKVSTVKLWRKIVTRENKKWTKKYHDKDPKKKCFGGKVIIKMENGKTISEEINVADAHPAGKRPFGRTEYINKFKTLTDGIISKKESVRFLKLVQNLRKLKAKDLKGLNVEVLPAVKRRSKNSKGIF
jgi:2-methylcitrate dehydratase